MYQYWLDNKKRRVEYTTEWRDTIVKNFVWKN